MKPRSALLAGASGLVGGYCLSLLLEEDVYREVKVLVRRPLGRKHPKLEEHVIDFDRLEDYRELIRADDVYCCLGTTRKQAGSRTVFSRVDYSYPREIARIAAGNGAERFLIITSIGAGPRSPIFYSRVKGKVEEAVKGLNFKGVYIFRPSMLLGEREKPRWGERLGMDLGRRISPALAGPLKRYRPIEAEAVAGAMVRTAKSGPEGVHVFESDRIQEIYDKSRKNGGFRNSEKTFGEGQPLGYI